MASLMKSCHRTLQSLCRSCASALTSNQNFYFIFLLRRACALGFKCFMRVIGPLMLTFANAMIFGVVVVYFAYLLPDVSQGSLVLCVLHVSFGICLLFGVLFNYYLCVATAAGSPPPCQDPGKYLGYITSVVDGRQVHHINHRLVLAPAVSYRICRHCRCIKPPRAHHCSISGKCILEMDHFCPWMNNCVGYNNYRYFVSFLIYLCVGAMYVIAVTLRPFLSLSVAQRSTFIFNVSMHTAIVFTFTIAISAFFSVGILLLWHAYLSLTNQTTIEFYLNMEERSDAKLRNETFKNPYDKGWRKNLRRVFGDVSWYSSLLPSFRLPPPPDYPMLPESEHLKSQQRIHYMV